MPKERIVEEVLNGRVVRIHSSINAAAASIFASRQAINHVLAGRSTHAKGYVFRYYEPDLEGEIWKDHESKLKISNLGRVMYPTGKKSFGTKSFHGYMYSHFEATKKRIHRLVLEAFVGACPLGYECDHIDRNRMNNNLNNLRWVTRKENLANKGVYKNNKTYH